MKNISSFHNFLQALLPEMLALSVSITCLMLIGLSPVAYASQQQWLTNKTNFLFIMFDDLRPELSIYGNNHMITPNFERLAKKSVVFDYGKRKSKD